MAENKVRFLRGTATEYASAVKDEDTFYYTTNDGKLYIGNKEVSGSGSIKIDNALSSTSENPVQNKVVTAALDEKVNSSDISMVATTGSYNDLSDKPTIPNEVTETTISGWGFTKNTGTYSKPSSGIPKSDLASSVQTSLGKADTALQQHQSLADYVKTTDSRLSDARTPTAHAHDDRYYTESEMDTKLSGKLNTSLKGAAKGLAELDSNGKVPSAQLPSYVDDVLEYTNQSSFPTAGESGKIYIAQDTNKTYRWSGSAYTEISSSLALGETSSTAYRGDRGKVAYDHSQTAHAPSNAQANVIETIKVNGTALTPSSKAVDITVPSVGNGTITITQNGTTKGTFTTNQSGNATIALTDNNTTYSEATTSNAGLLSASDKSKLDGIASGANAYTHPTYTAKASGLYKVTVDSTGHVSNTTAVTKSDITALGIPASDTNTHYTSKNVVGSSSATSNTTSALTNGNVYLNSVENGAVTSSHKISGSGATTVTSDANGNIIISSTDNNTTYDVATTSANGLMSAAMVAKLNGLIETTGKTPSKIVFGVYTGDNASSQQIPLGFRPIAVITSSSYDGAFSGGNGMSYSGMFALDGYPAGNSTRMYLEINDGGFQVSDTLNINDKTYRFVAFAHYSKEA